MEVSMKRNEELVVITKTYDLILWSCNHTGRGACKCKVQVVVLCRAENEFPARPNEAWARRVW